MAFRCTPLLLLSAAALVLGQACGGSEAENDLTQTVPPANTEPATATSEHLATPTRDLPPPPTATPRPGSEITRVALIAGVPSDDRRLDLTEQGYEFTTTDYISPTPVVTSRCSGPYTKADVWTEVTQSLARFDEFEDRYGAAHTDAFLQLLIWTASDDAAKRIVITLDQPLPADFAPAFQLLRGLFEEYAC